MSSAPSASVAGITPVVGEFSHTSIVSDVATGAKSPVPVRTVTVANRLLSSPSQAKNTKVSVPGTSGSCVYRYVPALTSRIVTSPFEGRHVMLYQMTSESGSLASIRPSPEPPGSDNTSVVCTASATGGSLTFTRSITR